MDETHLLSPDSTVADNNKSKKKNKKKKKKITQSRSKAKRYALITFEELPEYMKDNEYILNYYRANWPLKEALFSIVRWHNETLNAFNWICPILGVDSCKFDAYASSERFPQYVYQETTKLIDLKQTTSPEMEIPSLETAAARWPFYIFLAGSMFCLLSSSICHLFSCHSHHLNLFLVRIDYIGITVMIITSFFPPIYYIFQCNTHWQFIYLTGITIMGTFTIVTMLSPSLSTSKYRPFRVFLFMAMGLFGIVPAIHGLIVNWNEPQQNITLAYESVMALCYMIGTIFYVSRIPERWKPGWFDLAGHSHQIFHLFVIFGALAHYGAALVFLEYGHKVGCGISI
ncbi:hypothetical protein F0562_030168 [Nyssa sinensis]|uniref:Uncharacterized protein n=1 Tax=Nyssa sinensis TaxID=561372 RepID=A0A5J5AVJ3_9ASTE|nr:hypothetical protein F0562_030168 [Nyssa sinensis]